MKTYEVCGKTFLAVEQDNAFGCNNCCFFKGGECAMPFDVSSEIGLVCCRDEVVFKEITNAQKNTK